MILTDYIFSSTRPPFTYRFFEEGFESKSETLPIIFSICSKAHHLVCVLITQSCQSYTSVYSSNIFFTSSGNSGLRSGITHNSIRVLELILAQSPTLPVVVLSTITDQQAYSETSLIYYTDFFFSTV